MLDRVPEFSEKAENMNMTQKLPTRANLANIFTHTYIYIYTRYIYRCIFYKTKYIRQNLLSEKIPNLCDLGVHLSQTMLHVVTCIILIILHVLLTFSVKLFNIIAIRKTSQVEKKLFFYMHALIHYEASVFRFVPQHAIIFQKQNIRR